MVRDNRDRMQFKKDLFVRLKIAEVVNLKAVYMYAHSWFVDEEYCKDDGDFPEIYHLDKKSQKNGRLIIIRWRFEKEPFGIKFYKRTVDVQLKIIGSKPVEIIQDNKKFKADKAIVEIRVNAILEVDAEHKWRNHWLLKHLINLYVKRIINQDLDKNRQELRRDILGFQEAMKNYMNVLSANTKSPNKKQVANKLEPIY